MEISLNLLKIANFDAKIKILKFGSKMFYLDIFGLEFENTINAFEINALEFA